MTQFYKMTLLIFDWLVTVMKFYHYSKSTFDFFEIKIQNISTFFLYQTSTKTNKIILHRCLAKYWFLHVCVYLRMFVNTADTSIPYFLEVRLPLLYHDFFPCLCIYSTVNLLSPEKLFGKGFLVTFPMG